MDSGYRSCRVDKQSASTQLVVYISIKLRNYPPHAHTYMYTFITEQVALKGKEPAIVKINRVQYLYVDYTCFVFVAFPFSKQEGGSTCKLAC